MVDSNLLCVIVNNTQLLTQGLNNMGYQFPNIHHIDDVRAAIAGRDEFVIAERGEFNIVCYVVAYPDSFPEVEVDGVYNLYAAIRRECRGMIFCSTTGRIIRRPLHKFFNLFEKDETQLNKVDFTKAHHVYTKMDGSMIAPFEIGHGSGNIRFGTKMGLSEVAMQAEVFVAKNQKYMDFSKWCIANDITPIYEYTAPTNRIVLKYDVEQLTLLAARHMITGEYLQV